jgi:hypothetical protein
MKPFAILCVFSASRQCSPTVTAEPYCVQIHPVLNDQARDAMDAELIETMSVALKAACVELGLAIKPDAATSRLAQRIVDAARHGVHDPQLLTDAALEGLGALRLQ